MTPTTPTLGELVGQYADAIGRHGPDCPLALRLRAMHADNPEFLGYADALDRVKRHLGGKGVEKPSLPAHPMTRVLITGCRHWHCERLATRIVDRLVGKYGHHELVIVHGAAKGVDSAFADAAYADGVALEPHKADWDKHGPAAGPIRNEEMVKAGADLVIVVHRDLAASKGTLGCVRLALAARIPVWLIDGEDAAPKRIVKVDPLEFAT